MIFKEYSNDLVLTLPYSLGVSRERLKKKKGQLRVTCGSSKDAAPTFPIMQLNLYLINSIPPTQAFYYKIVIFKLKLTLLDVT